MHAAYCMFYRAPSSGAWDWLWVSWEKITILHSELLQHNSRELLRQLVFYDWWIQLSHLFLTAAGGKHSQQAVWQQHFHAVLLSISSAGKLSDGDTVNPYLNVLQSLQVICQPNIAELFSVWTVKFTLPKCTLPKFGTTINLQIHRLAWRRGEKYCMFYISWLISSFSSFLFSFTDSQHHQVFYLFYALLSSLWVITEYMELCPQH